MTTWAFIPARDSSTRFPNKNSALFVGTPLVVWAVEIAQEAQRLGLIDQVIVVTEGRNAGGVEPALQKFGITRNQENGPWIVSRPEALRRQEVRVIDLLRFYLSSEGLAESFGPSGEPPGAVCVLLPTSPLRQTRHLVESYRLLTPGVDVVLSVTEFRQDVRGALIERGPCCPGFVDVCDSERWPATEFLKHDGTALWCTTEFATRAKGFYDSDRIRAYRVPTTESADIDTPLDLEWAEFLHKRGRP